MLRNVKVEIKVNKYVYTLNVVEYICNAFQQRHVN